MRRHMFLCTVATAALLLAATGVAAAQDRQTTTGSVQAVIIVKGQPVLVDATFQRTGPPQSEFAAVGDVLRVIGKLAALSVELNRREIETAGMMCFRKDTGEKILCFPPPNMMTAGAPR